MKRSGSGKPYLSWALVVRNCERTLEATLKSIRERSPDAEIVVVDTCSRDRTPEIAQKYADVWELYRGPRGDWQDDFCPKCEHRHDGVGMFCQGCGAARAVDDMAAARERSFALASGRWRGWIDGDDRLPGPDETDRLLALNGYGPARGQTPQGAPEAVVGLEEVLRGLEESQPQITMVVCPYLYRHENGEAREWLERERFVRWDDPPAFRWAEPAHEILVPKQLPYPPRFVLGRLLFVHDKEWSGAAYEYSFKRHGAIVLKQYDDGDVTHRRARYLAATMCDVLGVPERKEEFVRAAYEHAWNGLDRYRALVLMASHRSARGFRLEARENFAAAQAIRHDLPDAYYAAGRTAFDAEEWDEAVVQFGRGIACELGSHSEVTPRLHAIEYPTYLSLALQRSAEARVQRGEHEEALGFFAKAVEIADLVRGRDSVVGHDKLEAQALFLRARNKWRDHKAAMDLKAAWDHLLGNDEPQKALALLGAFSWRSESHPLRVQMELAARRIRRHIDDPEAYRAFYASSAETGYVPMPEENYTYAGAHTRICWAVDWIKANKPDALVLDLGCCDGILGLPLLKECPTVRYRGVDVCEPALENFRRMAAALPDDAAVLDYQLAHGEWPDELFADRYYDVVVAGEIIEHVPDPVAWLWRASQHLRPDGALLLTTPWGSFDEGHPPTTTAHGTPRDERGHLRAYSPEQMASDLRDAGLMVEALVRVGGVAQNGHAMLVVARRCPYESERLPHGHGLRWKRPPVAVYVQGALWEWNGSGVERDGIGASESQIAWLGERLAGERQFDVYGPVPESEVHRGVGYFGRDAVRLVAPDAEVKLVISRAPAAFRHVDRLVGRELPAVLWLQDTFYPELAADPSLADRYERIVCVSEWHKGYTIRAHGFSDGADGTGAAARKIVVAPNFLRREEWEPGIQAGWPQKKRDHFVYASSPDRGLIKLLELWPRIREVLPEATLSVFYGWRGAAKLGNGAGHEGWNQRYLKARRAYERLRFQPGVTEHGMVGHAQLALEFQKAGVWAYPTDFCETFGTVGAEARAAGAVPVFSFLAGLMESADCEQGHPIPVEEKDGRVSYIAGYDDQFVECVKLAAEASTEERQAMARGALEEFSFEAVKPIWDEVLG